MARDYKNAGSKRRGKGGPAFSGWVGLGIGLTLGSALAAVVHLYHTGNPLQDQPVEPAVDATGDPGTETTERRRPRFTFYQMLPNYEVVIPEQDIAVAGTADNSVTDEGTYILQVGSFRNGGDADRLRAELALLGIESRIQTVTIDDTDTWHRVRVGPLRDLEVLNEVRGRLAANDHDALVIRVGD